MKKITIIGGNSALAKYLIQTLSPGNKVISQGRKYCDFYCNLQDDVESIVIHDSPDVVICTAAAFNGKTDQEIVQTEDVNAIGTLKICIAAKRANVKHLILISSQSAILKENSLYYGIYSLSKRHAEELATYYCSMNHLPLTILRPSQIYDAKGEFRKHQPLIYLIADNAEIGKDITIYGSNDALRNCIYIEDLIEIINRVIERRCEGIYSCTNISDIRLSDIAKAAQCAFNAGGKILFLKDKIDIPNTISENKPDLYEKIGFFPKTDIVEGRKKIAKYRMMVSNEKYNCQWS